ncbi:MAG: TraR/DksA family transcriptional regulator [Bradymonadales bacterium]|nr:MAG: TraR/DksA family transcriptional regulator [Bradymonadales bacterium]
MSQMPSKKVIETCRKKLTDLKQKHMNTLQLLSTELVKEASGDIADKARELQEEVFSLARREKLSQELSEIEQALDRIKSNRFGICEETGNPIEEKRLLSIPWTRLSLEGAEIREMERQEAQEELS